MTEGPDWKKAGNDYYAVVGDGICKVYWTSRIWWRKWMFTAILHDRRRIGHRFTRWGAKRAARRAIDAMSHV